MRRLAEPGDGPAAREVARIPRATGLAVLYGWPELHDGSVYDAATLVDRDRNRSRRTARHRYGDVDTSSFRRPGNGDFVTVPLDDVQVGLLICDDVEFPETVRSLASPGPTSSSSRRRWWLPYGVVARTPGAGSNRRPSDFQCRSRGPEGSIDVDQQASDLRFC